mmetsp:Transcript_30106/g.65694  ORF Transcript_30106/g.65694 Transcript_30106/m.65694 type:complete len:243 (-) Transcript_30106:551-1279(-)
MLKWQSSPFSSPFPQVSIWVPSPVTRRVPSLPPAETAWNVTTADVSLDAACTTPTFQVAAGPQLPSPSTRPSLRRRKFRPPFAPAPSRQRPRHFIWILDPSDRSFGVNTPDFVSRAASVSSLGDNTTDFLLTAAASSAFSSSPKACSKRSGTAVKSSESTGRASAFCSGNGSIPRCSRNRETAVPNSQDSPAMIAFRFGARIGRRAGCESKLRSRASNAGRNLAAKFGPSLLRRTFLRLARC